MYELIITEKPNASTRVAEALADGKVVKKSVNGVPYYELTHNGKKIVVGCAVGHLFGLAEKKKKKGMSYPVFDVEWKPTYELNKSSAFTKKYLDVLKKLAKDADVVTVATDFDVEGEVIGFNVVRFVCNLKDARRMKFSTLTKDELVEAYDKAAPHLVFGQAHAGETRHFLDFYYGINLSRALMQAIKKAGVFKILSIGRVQGPALKIVAEREREISAFKPVPYWQIELLGSVKKSSITAWHEADKFWEKKAADKVMSTVSGSKSGVVADVDAKQFKQSAPKPFDLTSLQTEAYRCFGLSPARTLQIAQELYTSGFTSYPRTSSQQLPESIGYAKILKALQRQEEFKDLSVELLKKKPLKPNNGQKTDPAHPAIYPTGIAPSKIEDKTAKVYELIVRRFLATFGDDAVRETMTVVVDVKGERFVAKGTRTVVPGWHLLYGPFVKLEEVELPAVKVKDSIDVKDIVLHSEETKPPKRYTPASLIKELEKREIGTKATRAEIIETLVKRNYIIGESITVTEFGMHIVKIFEAHCKRILDEDLTRTFESDMNNIREDKTTPKKVLDDAKTVLSDILSEFKSKETEIGNELKTTFAETRADLTTVGACPVCKGSLILRRGKFGRFIACDKYPECKTTFKLPASGLIEVEKSICQHCQYPMIKVIRKAKRPQIVCINLDCPSKQIVVASEQACPKCNEGKMVVRKSVYGQFLACNRFPKCRNIARSPKKPDSEVKA